MDRIYSVSIKGRTLESRNIRELLARAVSEKRSLDRMSNLRARSFGQTSVNNLSNPSRETHRAVAL